MKFDFEISSVTCILLNNFASGFSMFTVDA